MLIQFISDNNILELCCSEAVDKTNIRIKIRNILFRPDTEDSTRQGNMETAC